MAYYTSEPGLVPSEKLTRGGFSGTEFRKIEGIGGSELDRLALVLRELGMSGFCCSTKSDLDLLGGF